MTVSGSANLLSLLGLGGSTGNNNAQHMVGTAATLGLSLTLLRFMISKMDQDEGDSDEESMLRSYPMYQFLQTLVRRVLFLHHNKRRLQIGNGASGRDDESEDDNVPIIHQGACHCRSVQFELIAPRKVECKAARPGKIQYRHARVRARSFRFIRGANFVNMYYVNKTSMQKPKGPDEVGAHSFCSRCGVHFLHAPNSHSSALDVNVDCLETQDIKLKAAAEKIPYLALGSSVLGQWSGREGDGLHQLGYPDTISEENPPIMFPPVQKTQPFAGYNNGNHPLMRHQSGKNSNRLRLDSFDETIDDSTIDLVFPGSEKMGQQPPSTPSTVRTSQTESFQSDSMRSGVPPTLTLDTNYNTDMESVISMTSARSCFPALSSANSAEVGQQPSAQISPATTALAREQMQKYMKKHMSSTSTLSSKSSPKRDLSN